MHSFMNILTGNREILAESIIVLVVAMTVTTALSLMFDINRESLTCASVIIGIAIVLLVPNDALADQVRTSIKAITSVNFLLTAGVLISLFYKRYKRIKSNTNKGE